MLWVKILIAGWVILVVAIAANYIAALLGISTWYPFLDDLRKKGLRKTLENSGIPSLIFLFILYPLILGFAAYLAFTGLF
ncbi:hypothetical protein A2165_03210 [Candidatus Curtissbacteria bacterium RBG_13_40_7]|uniref:Uncharacterized protein n=1 Tax=Candidatus Curtissbacteria bacterium RBG_13_40_7 TaxID=1797706 RepID=A0A1F5FYP9_9BACT|nr:MAG: hypothetical protein A2165_03210 [Candidatus Curtissbacteria bacterium RBG_13_40_7]